MDLQARVTSKIARVALNERGGALVEIAIVMPIFLLLLASVGEFGRFMHTYTTLAKGTRAGARYLSRNQPTDTAKTVARNIVVCGKTTACSSGEEIVEGLSTSNVNIATQGGVPSAPETITVSITGYTFQPLFNLPALMGDPSFSLALAVSPSMTMKYLVAPN